MTSAVLTPFSQAIAHREGYQMWRKKLLPVGKITYRGPGAPPEGREIDFTADYMKQLADAFNDRAYGQVPFQIAGDDNKHTNDVERFRGEVAAFVPQPDGLYMVLATTPEGTRILEQNPALGVSARINEQYPRSDGKFYPAAIQHVLGTLDPHVPNLGGWQAVDLASTQADTVVDLSSHTFTPEEMRGGSPMPELTEQQQRDRLAKLFAIPEDQFDALLASLGQGAPAGTPPAGTPAGGQPGQQAPPAGTVPAGNAEEMSDAELAAVLASLGITSADGSVITEADLEELLAEEGEPVSAGASLSSAGVEQTLAIELANARAEETQRQLRVIQDELDGKRYESERRGFAENFGIPPYITDLAQPLLLGGGHVIDLANGQQADAGAIVRKLLTEIGKMGKMLDLGNEMGSSVLPDDGQEGQARNDNIKSIVDAFHKQTGV